ncbi:hypothetical protein GGF32_005035 [Allomyces javanicus]|nr:hypothetical protein GGF32_005035 [Allomyces javanicus]
MRESGVIFQGVWIEFEPADTHEPPPTRPPPRYVYLVLNVPQSIGAFNRHLRDRHLHGAQADFPSIWTMPDLGLP